MAETRDKVELLVAVLGQEGIDRLVKSTENYRGLLEDVARKFKEGDISAEEFYRTQAKMTRELEREEDLLRRLKRSTDDAAVATDKAAHASGNSAQSLMQLGRVVQDFQGGGILGITNNMEGMAMALGLGSGVAGVATLAAVALAALNPQIKALFATLKSSPTLTEAEAMKELEENTHRTAEETDRLNRFKQRQAELGKILAGQSQQQRDTKSLVEEFLGGGDGEKILGGLAQALAASGRGAQMTEAQKRRVEAMNIHPGMTEEEQAAERQRQAAVKAQVQAELNQANVEAAGKILGSAPTDRGARDTLRALAGKFPGAFPKNFAAHLGELEPEAIAQQDAEVEEFEAFGQRAHDAGVKRRKAAAEQKRKDAERHRHQQQQTDAILHGNAQQGRDAEAAQRKAEADAKRAEAERRRDEHAHGTAAERALAGQIQQQFTANTGGQLSNENALAAARQQIEENNRAQQQAAQEIAAAMGGMGQSTAMWNQLAQQARMTRAMQARMMSGLEQTPMSSGLGR